jgi:RimJ/RimL family protein N-acetyltransferase/GNAT superfamily N-acetyltransferase
MIKLQTDRLLIEEVSTADGAFIYRLLNSSNWLKFIGDRGIRSLDDALEYIENSLIKSYLDNGFGLYKLINVKSNLPIGLCGLLKRQAFDHPDIGFAILPSYEGKGYVFEAAEAILNHAKLQLQIDKVLAITTTMNFRSQKLLISLGLKMEGLVDYDAKGDFLLFSNQPKTYIVKASINDLKAINKLIWTSKKHWNYSDSDMVQWESALTLTPLELEKQSVYVMKSQQIIGVCAIKNTPEYVEINHLWVAPKHMKKGHGSHLLKTSVALSNLHTKPIQVEADPNAEAFYESLGFVTYDKKPSQIEGRYLPLMRKEK